MLAGRLVLARLSAPTASVVGAGRGLTTLAMRDDSPRKKPAPWPYWKKGFQSWHFYDLPLKRFDSNTKWIVVEGNIGAGKSTLAKQLADAFGFYHLKEPTMDDVLIDFYGKDQRDFYDLIPERMRLFDIKMFYENPFHINVAMFQYTMYMIKYENYINAQTHLLNTGQGVVMEGSSDSDIAFTNAMYKKFCFSKDFYEFYVNMRKCSTPFIDNLRPHLVIYLDTKPETSLERIHKRGIDYEINSEIMDLEYLAEIDRSQKQVLKNVHDRHSNVLIYDWNEPGDFDYVLEDIENADMGDTFDWHKGDKFETWHTPWSNWDWNYIRKYATQKQGMSSTAYPCQNVAELWVHPDDRREYLRILEEYTHGYWSTGSNPERDGLGKVLWEFQPKEQKWQKFLLANQIVDNQLNGIPIFL